MVALVGLLWWKESLILGFSIPVNLTVTARFCLPPLSVALFVICVAFNYIFFNNKLY